MLGIVRTVDDQQPRILQAGQPALRSALIGIYTANLGDPRECMLRIIVRARVDPKDAPKFLPVVLREFAAELGLARAAKTEDDEASLELPLIW